MSVIFDLGKMPTIAIVNNAKISLGQNLAQIVGALQSLIGSYLGPIWGPKANLVLKDKPGPGEWSLILLDNTDQADALGYHTLNSDGNPQAFVFVETCLQDGDLISVVMAHEIIEMLVDPGCQLLAIDSRGWIFALEPSDACQQSTFLINGIPVSNFVLPSWYQDWRKHGSEPFDLLGQIDRPFQLLQGGYASVYKQGRWGQLFGSREARRMFERRKSKIFHSRANRRYRREVH